MTVFRGTDQPSLKIIRNHETEGFKLNSLTVTSYIDTHMDVPSHVFCAKNHFRLLCTFVERNGGTR